MQSGLPITDAQIHLWGSGLPSNAAHRQVTAFRTDEALAMMDAAGVDGAVIHPPPWDPGALNLATEAVRAHPGRFAIMASPRLEQSELAPHLAIWRQRPGMLGLRYMFLGDKGRRKLDSLDWLWTAAEASAAPIALLATDHLDLIGRVAERHPGLRLTIDHLGGLGGNTTLKDAAAMTHMPALLELARYPNVAVKATGLPGYSGEIYPFPAMQGYLRQVFDAFGPKRTFWGTDITKMPCSWHRCITMFTEELAWLSGDDLRQVMGAAICRWWNWTRAAPLSPHPRPISIDQSG